MRLSFIIPTYNRPKDLQIVIEALLNQEPNPGVDYEIIVVGNNASDEIKQYLQEIKIKGVKTFLEKEQGICLAINRGIRESTGDIIVITSDDLILPLDRLKRISTIFKNHPEIECVTGKVLPLWDGPKPAWYSDRIKGVLVHVDYGAERKEVQYCVGANSAFRKSVFDRFGLFETSWRFEDVHFARRIRGKVKMEYFPDLVVQHPVHSQRLSKSYFRWWYFVAGGFEGDEAKLTGKNFLKVELWRYKDALKSLLQYFLTLGNPPKHLYHELKMIYFFGLLVERNRGGSRKS